MGQNMAVRTYQVKQRITHSSCERFIYAPTPADTPRARETLPQLHPLSIPMFAGTFPANAVYLHPDASHLQPLPDNHHPHT